METRKAKVEVLKIIMVSVLFVCTGNICRSPMAEGVFQHLVDEAGLSEHITVDSAGTTSYHVGETAHRGTLQELRKHNIPYNGRSRQITTGDYESFDYILVMDNYNLSSVQSANKRNSDAVIKMFLDYADGVTEREVPDPYYYGGFDQVYDLVEAGARGLLAAIREDHGL